MIPQGSVLVLGATGYVGGRLVSRLLVDGHRVRVMARNTTKAATRAWARHPLVELVPGDVEDLAALIRACQGCWAAFYLVHSMNRDTPDFAEADRRRARHMALAAAEAGLDRVIYLGGLTPEGGDASPHLASRAEVGEILAAGRCPCTILRAAMILGSGSASFEIMRYLVDRLPVMLVPSGIHSRVQPIAIRNVIGYLAGCLEHDGMRGQAYDIGGPDVVTYGELFQVYAAEAGLRKRVLLPVPFMTPKRAAALVSLFTPLPAAIVRPLAAGLGNSVVCRDFRIREIIPQDLMDVRRTIRRVLVKEQQQMVETRWTDAGLALPQEWAQVGDERYAGGAVIATGRRLSVPASPAAVWARLARIGGSQGWYFATWLWRLRGRVDRLLGGAGNRGRNPDPQALKTGDAIDFWRVAEITPGRRLLLIAEMKVPGEMVLDFTLTPDGADRTMVEMTGRFLPRGLWGLIYWYLLLPFHKWLYRGVLREMGRRAAAPGAD